MRGKDEVEKNLKGPRRSSFLLGGAALIPVCVLFFLALTHLPPASVRETADEEKFVAQAGAKLDADMKAWPALRWSEKENLVHAAILLFRSRWNAAILKSPAHYVVQIDHLFAQDPSAMGNNPLAVVKGLAITEYDFYNGENADEQALKFLGPVLFEENRRMRQLNEESVVPLRQN